MDGLLIFKIVLASFLVVCFVIGVFLFIQSKFFIPFINRIDGALKEAELADLWSLQRFNSFVLVLISNLLVWGYWIIGSIFAGKMLDIPESVLILYGSANGIAGIFKVFQKKYEREQK